MPLLAVPEPFDFALSTERFRVFGVDRATAWHEGGLHRVVNGREVRIEAAPGGVEVEPFEPDVARLLGLEFELDAFAGWACGDPVLHGLVERLRGFRPPLVPDPFEMLVGAITAQQVSLFSATAIRNRLIERFGERHDVAWAFPTRERLAAAQDGELTALGFSRRKEEYVLALARSDLDLDALRGLPDDEVRARIVAQRGLGEWTAAWFLARHLARPHAWPWGDLALRKAVADLYRGLDVRKAGPRFHPFENLSAHYLLLAQRIP
jgi:AraC family transcriptional regulator of adaptative response / DNA-3-methyladenine glycosylase II